MRELWRISVNEWIKLVRRKRMWVCALLGLALVALFTYGGYRDQQNRMNAESPAMLQTQIANIKTQLADTKSNSSDPNAKQTEQQLQSELQGLQNQYQQSKAETGPNWKADLQKQVAQLQQQENQAATTGDKQTVGGLQQQIMQLQYSIDHNVRPTPSWVTTPFQMLQIFLTEVTQIFMPLITVILVADIVAGETTSGTIKLLLIRPASRAKILFGKWLVGLFGTAVLSLGISAAFLGAAVVVLGGGGGGDPTIVGTTYTFVKQPGTTDLLSIPHLNHAHVMSLAAFDVRSIGLMVLAMLAVATIAFLCSVLFQSAMASTAVALGVIIVGTIGVQLIHGHWVVALFPLHLDLAQEWTGQLAQQMQMSVGLGTGFLVLGIWTVVALVVSLYRFSHRDVLNA
jgi:ABC-2 type transport system permease protein